MDQRPGRQGFDVAAEVKKNKSPYAREYLNVLLNELTKFGSTAPRRSSKRQITRTTFDTK